MIAKSLNKIFNTSDYPPQLIENDVVFCRKLNVSECKLSEENDKFVLHIYNPMGHRVEHLVRVPIKKLKNEHDILLLNSKAQSLDFDVVDIADHVKV